MSTRYVWIKAEHEPYDLQLDSAYRQQYGFNFIAQRVMSLTSPGDFEDEIVGILTAAGVGTFGATIFVGSNAQLPSGDGPFLTLIATGGMGAQYTQNRKVEYRNPTAQICVHGKDSVAAKTMAYAAYDALVAVQNKDV